MIKLLSTILISFILSANIGDPNGYKVGDKATDFKLKNIDDTFVSMADSKENKGYIVVFTCNTCPVSVLYEDRIIEMHNKYAPKGYPVIAINPNDPKVKPGDSFEKMKVRAKEKGFPFPYVFDSTQEITIAYGATNTPHVYIVENVKDDYIVRYIGAIDNNSKDAKAATKHYVDDAMSSLLGGQSIDTPFTKAIGCTIKWSEASKKKLGK
jgi:peroxiredoxin